MTSVRKIVTWAALVVFAGVVLYQTIGNHRLRNEIQVLQQEVGSLEERNTTLESDYNVATNQLIAALSSAHNQTSELLRLRGEVSGLKRVVQEQAKARGQEQMPPTANEATQTEAGLDAEQRKFVADMTENIKTKNSVDDINRLKDTLARWDTLSTNMVPAKMWPVLPTLKQRVIERVAELETEAAENASRQTR